MQTLSFEADSTPPAWQTLVDPANSLRHPRDVLARADLSRETKRAILAAWASDAHTVESHPALRSLAGAADSTVQVGEVLSALRRLDGETARDSATTGRSPRAGLGMRRPFRPAALGWRRRFGSCEQTRARLPSN